MDFQQFGHVIRQCICYANKRPLTQQALRECNPEDQFQIVTPEFLKFGYETAVLEVGEFGKDDSNDWKPVVDVDIEQFRKLKEIKDRLRKQYQSEFIYGLMDQATKLKNKYIPVHHENIDEGDIVLIKNTFVKAPNYPLARVLHVVRNSLGEVTQAVLLKGNRSLVKRDTSSIIPLVKNGQPGGACGLGSEHLVDTVGESSGQRSRRQATIASREKTKEMIESADV